MRIPWQNNGPRILLSLSLSPLFLVHRSPPSTDHPPRASLRSDPWKEARSSGRNGVLASQNTLRPSKLPSLEPAYVHSDVPRVLVARRSVDYIGTCAVATQPAARQNYCNRGVAFSTAWYLLAYTAARVSWYIIPVSACSPVNQIVDYFCQVCFFFGICFVSWFRAFLNWWYLWSFIWELRRVWNGFWRINNVMFRWSVIRLKQ